MTAYNLSFSVDDDSYIYRQKIRASKKHQQYILASEYNQELLTRLPLIDKPCTEKDHEYGKERRLSTLGITGVGQQTSQPIYDIQHVVKTDRRYHTKNKPKTNAKIKDFSLPKLQSKSLKDKSDKQVGLFSLMEKFRPSNGPCLQQNHSCVHKNSAKQNIPDNNTDTLLSQIIERVKLEQKIANKQLESTILRGKSVQSKT